MAGLFAFFFQTRIGNVVGLLVVGALIYGGIYAKGRLDERQDQRVKQVKANELATKERREVDRAVPRTDWDDRVDELR